MNRLRAVIPVVAFLAALVLTGCGDMSSNPNQSSSPNDTAQALKAISALPTLEDTAAQLKAAVEEIGRRTAAVVPGITWEWTKGGGGTDHCARPYDQTGGYATDLDNYVASDITVSPQQWQQITDITGDVATRFKVALSNTFHNRPGNYDFEFSDETGTTLRIGYAGNLVITASTGCRLSKRELEWTTHNVTPTQ